MKCVVKIKYCSVYTEINYEKNYIKRENVDFIKKYINFLIRDSGKPEYIEYKIICIELDDKDEGIKDHLFTERSNKYFLSDFILVSNELMQEKRFDDSMYAIEITLKDI